MKTPRRWTAEDDAVIAPWVANKGLSNHELHAVAERLGRTRKAVLARIQLLRFPERAARFQKRRRVDETTRVDVARSAGHDLGRRKCLMCRAVFTYDRTSENYFRCQAHRGSDAWMSEGGGTGSRKSASRT